MSGDGSESLRALLRPSLDAIGDELRDTAHSIHGFAELAYQERRSAALLGGVLEAHGIAVERGVAGMETAFVAETGADGPTVAYVCEYDALPGMGHACGHNIIAGASLGAGVALARALATKGHAGRVRVVGAPAEESGGGKIALVEAGVFDDVDAALILHPSDRTTATIDALACTHWEWSYTGRAAHAASDPHLGINALDAFVHAYVGVAAWRQQLPEGARVHGVILEGGTAANVIPDHTSGTFITRARTWDQLDEMNRRFADILQAAAAATGCALRLSRDQGYRDMRANQALAAACRRRLAEVGLDPVDAVPWERAASTDAGNLSYAAPTLHPEVAISEPGVRYHTDAFREVADSPRAYAVMLRGAEALALLGADVCGDDTLRQAVRTEFARQPGRREAWRGSGA